MDTNDHFQRVTIRRQQQPPARRTKKIVEPQATSFDMSKLSELCVAEAGVDRRELQSLRRLGKVAEGEHRAESTHATCRGEAAQRSLSTHPTATHPYQTNGTHEALDTLKLWNITILI